jgi:hypothetical protein
MNYWILGTPDGQRLAKRIDTEFERLTCPEEPGTLREGKRLSDLTVLIDPRAVRAFTWTGNGELLVLPKVLRLFEIHGVTGFEAKPVKVRYPDEIELDPPELHEIIITGWGGFAAPGAGVSLTKWCHGCGCKYYTIAEPSQLIDASAWDGSDLFFVWPVPRARFASDRLATLLRCEKLSGLELIPASNISMEKGDRLGTVPLTCYFPEHCAHELDQRFGISRWPVGAG